MADSQPYRSLSDVFYRDPSPARFSRNEELARRRLEADSTFRTGFEAEAGELFVAVPRELSVLAEAILRLERRVSQGYRALPGLARGSLVTDLVADEVVSSNDLEGVRSTKRQVIDSLRSQEAGDGKARPRRFGGLARLYRDIDEGPSPLPSTVEDVRAVYDHVMAGEELGEDAPDGRLFRKGGVEVVGSGSRVIHRGVEGEGAITEGVEAMLRFARDPEVPALLSAVASHFWFEYLHPFYDGNGRCGRYLLALFLSRPLSPLTSLSLSRVFAGHRDSYYRSFREAERPLNHGELTFFVLDVLGVVREAQHRLVASLERAGRLIDEAEATLFDRPGRDELGRRGSEALFVLFQLELFGEDDRTSWDDMARHLRVSKQTARRTLASLERLGYVRKTRLRPLAFGLTGRARDWLGIGTEASRP